MPVLVFGLLRRPAPSRRLRAGDGELLALALAIGLSSFVVRLRAPIGINLLHIQLAYAPPYVLMFAAGVMAARHELLARLESERLARWLLAAVGAFGCAALLSVAAHDRTEQLRGGLSWPALGWALSESLCGTSISVCLLIAFRAWVAGRTRLSETLAAHAFAAFVVHAPLVVAVALVFSRAGMPSLVAWMASLWVAIPTAFCVALLLRRIPAVEKVL